MPKEISEWQEGFGFEAALPALPQIKSTLRPMTNKVFIPKAMVFQSPFSSIFSFVHSGSFPRFGN
ncbi:hypothetical protein Cflav_PD1744 [Pedosphaera parvula Ellin514]|uniref:Uncharacterized protein n=1 Tax=Pedosphaera parvula (strain Ellin514) TaxID=320771 RepID=B9XNL4_PEDPL|nr:hypothetical protein Cflav_PD1744 [Pedosphaera parvula Ellin514]